MPVSVWWSYSAAQCRCSYERTEGIGRFDVVTGEWLADAPTTLVAFTLSPACPIHEATR